jgi:hypothetical protein
LPKRVKYGFAVKTPFIFAVDFEQNSSPISLNLSGANNTTRTINISNLRFIRVGSQLGFFSGGITLIAKPDVTGLTNDEKTTFDKAFRFGYFPTALDLGLQAKAWDNLLGLAVKVNPQLVLNSLQLDTTNMELSKLAYGNLYFGRGPWLFSYLLQADTLATLNAYQNKTVPAGQTKNFEASDLKLIQSIGVTYQF